IASTVVRPASSSKPPALGFSCTSLTTTFAPSAAYALAMPRPKPELAPVTTTTLSWRRAMMGVLRSGGGEAAVDGEQGAGGPAGVAAGQEEGCLRHVLGGAKFRPRGLFVQRLVQLGVLEEGPDHRGGQEPRADAVDVDPFGGKVDGELPGEIDYRSLRRAVRRLGGQPDEAADGGDVDDAAA